LLLKVPNMLKIAGELTPTVFHITARTLATHALSIFRRPQRCHARAHDGICHVKLGQRPGGHGFRAHRAGGHAESRIPFLHFFDGFRTSHEVSKIELVTRRSSAR